MQLSPRIFDRALIARHLERRPSKVDDFVTALVLRDLEDRLATLLRPFPAAVMLGLDANALPATAASGQGEIRFERVNALGADGELPAFAQPGYDLIVSILDLQVVNDVPGYLSQLARRLNPDGLFLAAALGGNTLSELREAFLAADSELSGGAYPRVAPFIQVRDGGGLLQRAGLALPVADIENHVVRYANPLALMAEIKSLGAANPLHDRPRKPATKKLLGLAAQAYAEHDADPDGRIRATLDILWLSGWAPHESQQKPLAPGSATTSLKSVLEKPKG
ncbi:SAM-dependent methyltransferase [Devosia rhodophyticola]|uniref:SAM-dependent methyltransferase n=1 Tax=Devosia rhodophyticola TaxID=3026423 RepID=A0ABY7YU31_9HYPH|nr:SAM-dependent methyltransferase [Devosia rhodophyticola]WDR04702.1 SAM-dependent methyltransferase [Devosia rhodophyticola]